DMKTVGLARAIYAALLTPQGKYLHDFFVLAHDGALLLDCERARLEDLKKRLAIYKLRSRVTLEDVSDNFAVAALFGDNWRDGFGLGDAAGAAVAFAGGVVCVDPRLADAGGRVVLPRGTAEAVLRQAGLEKATAAEYDRLRLSLGLPDGSRDLVVDKSILLESGFDELNGVDWKKGCYIGQELTARTKYRGLVKKRLVPVVLDGPPPQPRTPVMLAGREAGEMRSAAITEKGSIGLALLRLESLAEADRAGGGLQAGGVRVTPEKAPWMAF
ncbi:MAG: folate-binding protein YgfZ, partial [Rhodospirillales bacterium]|nr:folate-binding protein YgfZ [Rhodospirillales bacterium]